jgi:hypothetical protein
MSDVDIATETVETDPNVTGAALAPDQVDTTGESATPPADTAAKDPNEQKRSGGGFQKRIDRLTRENDQAWSVANRALTLLEERQQPTVPTNDEPQQSQFKTYEDYLKAVSRYEARQEASRQSQEADQRIEQRAQEADAQRRSDEFKSRLAREGKAIEGFGEILDTLYDPTFAVSPTMAQYLIEADKPAHLAQWLVENEDEARRISRLNPIAAAKELTRVEADLAKPVSRATKAPAPPPGVPGAGGVAATKIETMSHADLKVLVGKWSRR